MCVCVCLCMHACLLPFVFLSVRQMLLSNWFPQTRHIESSVLLCVVNKKEKKKIKSVFVKAACF